MHFALGDDKIHGGDWPLTTSRGTAASHLIDFEEGEFLRMATPISQNLYIVRGCFQIQSIAVNHDFETLLILENDER